MYTCETLNVAVHTHPFHFCFLLFRKKADVGGVVGAAAPAMSRGGVAQEADGVGETMTEEALPKPHPLWRKG